MCTLESNNRMKFWSFDLLKLALALIVLMRHFCQSFVATDSYVHTIIVNIISPVAVPTFFAISGFLFFLKRPTLQRVMHQAKRIFILYLCWTFVYLPYSVYTFAKYSSSSIVGMLLHYVRSFFFEGSYYHLWFLPALIFSLFFVWFLNNHFKQSLQFIILTFLFICGTIVENFKPWLPGTVQNVCDLYETVFVTTRNGLFFGSLFVWIGKYYAEKYKNLTRSDLKKYRRMLLPAFALIILEGTLVSLIQQGRAVNMLFCAVPFVFVLFAYIVSISVFGSCKYETTAFRKMSTVIFCVHPIAFLSVRVLNVIGFHLSVIPKALLLFSISIIISFIWVKLIPKIRILEYFV